MNSMYTELFKALVNSYYEGTLRSKIDELLSDEKINKDVMCEVISSLCGVTVNLNENYIQNLESAIKNYSPCHKVVNKIGNCNLACIDVNGETLCEKSCPFNAIFTDKSKQTSIIDSEKCTDCGFCVDACPEGKILDKIEFIPLSNILKGNATVIAAVAPAIIGQFGEDVTIDQLRSAFKKIGFTDMVEVAFFADMLTLKEAVEFNKLVHDKHDFMITSCCCPMWVGMLKKVYSELIKYVSPSVSPMAASGRVLKRLNPDCKVVFIGPCVAKKAEAKEKDISNDIDYVMTFQELKSVFEALKINPVELQEDISTEYSSRCGRLYGRTGGVSIAVGDTIKQMFPEKQIAFNPIQADGVVNCKELLAKAQNGELEANFLEGMGCVGGCVGGPKAIISKEDGMKFVDEFANKCDIKIPVDSTCMNLILEKLDINSCDDFKLEEKIEIFKRTF